MFLIGELLFMFAREITSNDLRGLTDNIFNIE